jgi:hypothetical protein
VKVRRTENKICKGETLPLKNFTSGLKNQGVNILILLALSGMFFIRLTAYGSLNLSVGNGDTPSYILGGAPPFPSKDMLTRGRLFTTNLLYRATNVQDCKLEVVSYPAIQTETYRGTQPCFDKIALFQNILALIAWGLFAWVVSRKLIGGFERLLSAVLITAFGFTPAIADWDSVLGSESLTFSLFAIGLASVIEIYFMVAEDKFNDKLAVVTAALGVVVLTLWSFTRDANIYTLLVLVVMSILSVGVTAKLRKNKTPWILLGILLLVTLTGLQSAKLSRRWESPLTNVYNDLLLPYPARVDYLRGLGMPDPKSSNYPEWFLKNAPQAYARFLLSHPGYTLTSFTSELDGIFSENTQPYFFSKDTPARRALVTANDLLHPKTYLFFALDILLMAGLFFSTFRRNNAIHRGWLWLMTWLFLSASATMGVGFFADSVGVTRHTMFAVELFRVMFWLLLLILLDQANRRDETIGAG